MTPSDIAKKVRLIQLRTRRAVNDLLAGDYISAFKGTGMEFEEVREYQPGDDVKSIDWNVTARQGHPYIKRFREERELTVMFAVDLSASGNLGTTVQTKNAFAAELCAMLALSAVKSNDKVGLTMFTDRIESYVPPVKGTVSALRLVRDVLAFQPVGKQTDIAGAVDFLGHVLRKRAVVFFLSDFQDANYLDKLAAFGRRHDVVAIRISDPLEQQIPPCGLLRLQDEETGEDLLIDASSHKVQRQFARAVSQRQAEQAAAFRARGIDMISLQPMEDYAKKLITFFKQREHANA